jgi:hypothetical protein
MVEYQLPKATAVAIRHVELVINGQTASVPVHALRLGSTIFVGIAAEAPSDLQIGLRRRFPNQSLVVMNDLNGHVGRIESAVVLESLIEPCAVVVKEVLGR